MQTRSAKLRSDEFRQMRGAEPHSDFPQASQTQGAEPSSARPWRETRCAELRSLPMESPQVQYHSYRPEESAKV